MLAMGGDFGAENVHWSHYIADLAVFNPEIFYHFQHGAYLETDKILAIISVVAIQLCLLSAVVIIIKVNLIF